MFAQNCSACHQLTGKGIPGAFPALAGSKLVQGSAPPLAILVLNGRGGMPTFKAELTDEQIADILSYVRTSWGNKAPVLTAAAVAKVRSGGAASSPGKTGATQAH